MPTISGEHNQSSVLHSILSAVRYIQHSTQQIKATNKPQVYPSSSSSPSRSLKTSQLRRPSARDPFRQALDAVIVWSIAVSHGLLDELLRARRGPSARQSRSHARGVHIARALSWVKLGKALVRNIALPTMAHISTSLEQEKRRESHTRRRNSGCTAECDSH